VALKGMLAYVPAYVALQRVVGADRLRYRCIERLGLRPGDTVVDVGCGPAYYFERLPQPLVYHGFDTEPRYIEWARRRWGDRATFHLATFSEQQAESLPPVDAILLLGLLHHLSDEQSANLLELSATVLAPGGRVVAVDTCFEPSQGRIARWMARNDRGEHVREPEGFVQLARTSFDGVEGEVVSQVTRVPGSYWVMTMTRPRKITAPAD
jgi:SAM-dependent methyltransferase